MISFNLRCAKDHVFEAWFRDSAAFEKQRKAKALSCPRCGNTKIEKAVMAPNIARSNITRAAEADDTAPVKLRNALVELREMVEANCDYVGSDFPEEARKVHYGESERRNMYGEASPEEARELAEEGIEFGRIPWIPRADS